MISTELNVIGYEFYALFGIYSFIVIDLKGFFEFEK